VDENPGNRFLIDWRNLNYSYLVLVAAGLVLAVLGFIKNGSGHSGRLGAAVMFLAGIIMLTFGILLTNVPGFFSG
jgi:hypothetical protein